MNRSYAFVLPLLTAIILAAGCSQNGDTSPQKEQNAHMLSAAEIAEKHADIFLTAALVFEKDGYTEHAITTLQHLTNQFPDTAAAKIAADKLTQMSSRPDGSNKTPQVTRD